MQGFSVGSIAWIILFLINNSSNLFRKKSALQNQFEEIKRRSM